MSFSSGAGHRPRAPLITVHNRRWFAAAWMLATVVFLGLAVLALQSRNSDRNQAVLVAEDFVMAMQAGDGERAYLLGSPAFRAATSRTALDDSFSLVLPLLSRSVIEKTDENFVMTAAGPRAVVVYRAEAEERQMFIRLIVEKRQGEWRVYSLQTSAKELGAK